MSRKTATPEAAAEPVQAELAPAVKAAKRTAFQSARRACVPIIGIESPDPAATMARIVSELNGKGPETAVLVHDTVCGLRAWRNPKDGEENALGAAYANEVSPEPLASVNVVECLALLCKANPQPLPRKAVVFMLQASRWVQDPGAMQAAWNCRDLFASLGATLVLIGPGFTLPPELQRDVVILPEELPAPAELAALADSICGDAGLPMLQGEDRERATDTLRGLAAFEATQTLAMSIDPKTGVDFAGLWSRKVKAIEATPGLTVYQGKERFDDVAGWENAKRIFGGVMAGPLNPTCLVLCDEIEKSLSAAGGGAGSDSSGTSQDQLKVLLTHMQDRDILAGLFLGPPGTGKSLFCKALASEFNRPLIMLDLGALKGSLVGQSEGNMRAAIKIIDAISGGRALWIGACNRDANLPPELRRRFSFQLLFADLPSTEELAGAWAVHTQRLRFQGEAVTLAPELCDWEKIDCRGWTGAEVRNCALKAYAMNTPCSEAAKTIVPISRSAGDVIEGLRRAASGRYVSASKPGLYQYQDNKTAAPVGGRNLGGV